MTTLDTSNLRIDYFTDTVSLARRIVIGGADPSHSPDLRKLGGEFHCCLAGGKRGWVFGGSMGPKLEKYIKTGKITNRKGSTNVLDMPKEGEKKNSGMCCICKKSVKLDMAVKNYVLYYTGGLSKKITGLLMDEDYRTKIAVALGNNTFACVDCMHHDEDSDF